MSCCTDFNPHSPCGERPSKRDLILAHCKFQSTLPLRGATRGKPRMILRAPISIHTPLAGSDFANALAEQEEKNFNPHSPCGERHCAKRTVADNQISIHTPLAGSDVYDAAAESFQSISIHTPLAGSDTIGLSIVFFRCISIHTPLAGSDTIGLSIVFFRCISIHTPLAGSDRH